VRAISTDASAGDLLCCLAGFWAEEVPELGRGIGDGIRELKKGLNDASASKAEQKTSEVKKG